MRTGEIQEWSQEQRSTGTRLGTILYTPREISFFCRHRLSFPFPFFGVVVFLFSGALWDVNRSEHVLKLGGYGVSVAFCFYGR